MGLCFLPFCSPKVIFSPNDTFLGDFGTVCVWPREAEPGFVSGGSSVWGLGLGRNLSIKPQESNIFLPFTGLLLTDTRPVDYNEGKPVSLASVSSVTLAPNVRRKVDGALACPS